MEPLTELERKVLDFMIEYLRRNTYQPSVREICAALGIRSTRKASELLQSLEAKQWIERTPSRSRGVRVLGLVPDEGAAPPGDACPEYRDAEPGDAHWMQCALEHARAAAAVQEVPVGAVLVHDGRIIADSHNLTRTMTDPTAHAELVTIRRAAMLDGHVRLLDATLYVTLEPCAMCAGAIVLAKVGRLVYGAADPKTGMCGSLACIVQDRRLNHRVRLTRGVLAQETGEVLRQFFRERRGPD